MADKSVLSVRVPSDLLEWIDSRGDRKQVVIEALEALRYPPKFVLTEPMMEMVRISAREAIKDFVTSPAMVGLITTAPIKPDMQALRDICAGKLPSDMPSGATGYNEEPIIEVEFCGKTWWEDGEQYECLMDKGHPEAKVGKHGLRGLVSTVKQ